MHVGIDIRSLVAAHPTGVGRFTSGLLEALFEQFPEHEFTVFFNAYRDVRDRLPNWNYKNVRFVNTSYPNKLFHPLIHIFNRPRIDKIIEKKTGKKVDVFFSPNMHFTALGYETKRALLIHDMTCALFPEWYSIKRRIWHRMLHPIGQMEEANIVFVPSESTKQDAMKHGRIPERKIKVLAPGVPKASTSEEDMRKLVEKYRLPSQFALFVGTVEPRKNIETIVEATRKVGMPLIIAGPRGWNCKSIFKQIDDEGHVQYLGYVTEDERTTLTAAATVVVYPSLYEGFGFPILEAFALGTPVITSNVSSLPDVAGSAAYVVNPKNVADVARGLKMFKEDEEFRNHYIEKGRKRTLDFSWYTAAKEFMHHISNL
jgi:glycosyltransferase involved in cell wall biosynthesis